MNRLTMRKSDLIRMLSIILDQNIDEYRDSMRYYSRDYEESKIISDRNPGNPESNIIAP